MVVRDAATVMLVRDGPAGTLQVLLQQRSFGSEVGSGNHVFPGGVVDAGDRAATMDALCVGGDDATCSARLGLERGGLAFWVAAVRESFEEAGVLLARPRGGDQPLSFLDPAVAARFAAHRAAVTAGRPLSEVLVEEGLALDVGLLHYVSHWVTPEGAPRRYDTRFFVASAPPEQVPLHDDGETIATTWLEPEEALARNRQGRLVLVLPTVRNLEFLRPFTTVAEALEAARGLEHVPTIRPRLVVEGDRVRILLPDDPGFDDAAIGSEGVP
jgi:8-oxo-dGTP pyrophosphatase MutT (NUDIX family)